MRHSDAWWFTWKMRSKEKMGAMLLTRTLISTMKCFFMMPFCIFSSTFVRDKVLYLGTLLSKWDVFCKQTTVLQTCWVMNSINLPFIHNTEINVKIRGAFQTQSHLRLMNRLVEIVTNVSWKIYCTSAL